MRIDFSKNKHNQIYIPKNLREVLGLADDVAETVSGVADTRTVLMIQKGMRAKDVLKSLEIIQKHFKYEAEIETEKERPSEEGKK